MYLDRLMFSVLSFLLRLLCDLGMGNCLVSLNSHSQLCSLTKKAQQALGESVIQELLQRRVQIRRFAFFYVIHCPIRYALYPPSP